MATRRKYYKVLKIGSFVAIVAIFVAAIVLLSVRNLGDGSEGVPAEQGAGNRESADESVEKEVNQTAPDDQRGGHEKSQDMVFRPVPPEVIKRANTGRMEVAITLDDGWNADPRILDLLRSHGIRCTVFIIGDRQVADAHPDWVRSLDSAGFEVCTHTLNHAKLTNLPVDQVRYEVVEGQRVIWNIIGKQYFYFRPPGGYLDDTVIGVVSSLGYKIVLWSLDSGDTANPSLPASSRASAILNAVKPGDILLFHFGGYKTFETLSMIIPQLKARGYSMVTLTELLKP